MVNMASHTIGVTMANPNAPGKGKLPANFSFGMHRIRKAGKH